MIKNNVGVCKHFFTFKCILTAIFETLLSSILVFSECVSTLLISLHDKRFSLILLHLFNYTFFSVSYFNLLSINQQLLWILSCITYVRKELDKLHDQYVLVLADKAGNNVRHMIFMAFLKN